MKFCEIYYEINKNVLFITFTCNNFYIYNLTGVGQHSLLGGRTCIYSFLFLCFYISYVFMFFLFLCFYVFIFFMFLCFYVFMFFMFLMFLFLLCFYVFMFFYIPFILCNPWYAQNLYSFVFDIYLTNVMICQLTYSGEYNLNIYIYIVSNTHPQKKNKIYFIKIFISLKSLSYKYTTNLLKHYFIKST